MSDYCDHFLLSFKHDIRAFNEASKKPTLLSSTFTRLVYVVIEAYSKSSLISERSTVHDRDGRLNCDVAKFMEMCKKEKHDRRQQCPLSGATYSFENQYVIQIRLFNDGGGSRRDGCDKCEDNTDVVDEGGTELKSSHEGQSNLHPQVDTAETERHYRTDFMQHTSEQEARPSRKISHDGHAEHDDDSNAKRRLVDSYRMRRFSSGQIFGQLTISYVNRKSHEEGTNVQQLGKNAGLWLQCCGITD